MPLEIKRSVKQMFDESMKEVETLNVDQAKAMHGVKGVTFIDLRDPREIWRDGGVPGAINVTRGMLEFWIDPGSPYHKPCSSPTATSSSSSAPAACVRRWPPRRRRTWA